MPITQGGEIESDSQAQISLWKLVGDTYLDIQGRNHPEFIAYYFA